MRLERDGTEDEIRMQYEDRTADIKFACHEPQKESSVKTDGN